MLIINNLIPFSIYYVFIDFYFLCIEFNPVTICTLCVLFLLLCFHACRLEREPSVVPSTPLTPRSVLFSSDEEYRTASEGGRRESEDWGEPLTPLPPSPPLNRTPISRVKEKAR